jgi:hypothetical protein
VSTRPLVLLDSEPQTCVYQIHPLDKVRVLLSCPLVLACSSICLQVQGCSWHSKNNTIGGGVTVAKAQLQPLWCCSRAAQRRSSSNRVTPTLIERTGTNPSGFHHVVIRARFIGESIYRSYFTYCPKSKQRNESDLRIPRTSLSLCCST